MKYLIWLIFFYRHVIIEDERITIERNGDLVIDGTVPQDQGYSQKSSYF